jgi:adenylate cyclase
MKAPIPIRGPIAVPFRIFGITQSKMNPNICTICERAFRKVKKGSHISEEATILFGDIRGYTELSERIDPLELANIVSEFQDQCADGIWAKNGIVNKQMGDGVMAIFNFPIKADDHANQAVAAAVDIQARCKLSLSKLVDRLGIAEVNVGVGVGIHTGQVEIGEFSKGRSDFTAIGGVVNMAARLEAKATAGEVVLSPQTAALVPELTRHASRRTLNLKGIAKPIEAIVISLENLESS